ncbi:hypothetical protein JI743_06560 [Sphingopyxis sp. DHUNG17]|uniref:hypothetical protein n=1 Tax=Sphingopyxis jiangsuensis TaxID=2871171 RepID=UPI00191F647D|nr:hypothetical protein [Sphingopyxis lutea]MBL0768462.1 hypothetical protein [Sphingopyxis lutea]
MRTILLLGVAAGTLLLSGRASSAEPHLDYSAPATTDTRVYTGYPDRVPSEVDYRRVDGHYEAEGRWSGRWDGTYEAPDGRRYEGSYEGVVEGRPGTSYAPPPYHPAYDGASDSRHDEDMYRRCGRGGAGGGAVVGGLVGGIAGNRIAGKGNRTAGTLIGGGGGALVGAAIGDAAERKKCEEWWASRGEHQIRRYRYDGRPGTTHRYYGSHAYGHYGYGWYTPGVVITTIIEGEPLVTETVETTTKTYYETAPVRKRYVAKKRTKPKAKPKPRCVC